MGLGHGGGGGCVFALWDSFKLIIIIVTKSKLALIVPSQVKIQLLLIEDLMEMFLLLKREIDIKMIQQKRNFSCYCEETKKSFISELDGVRNYLTKNSSKKL